MKRMISPRLADGSRREQFGHGLPPAIKSGLRAIAKSERQSMAWVLEQVVIEYFGLKSPVYVTDVKKTSRRRRM